MSISISSRLARQIDSGSERLSIQLRQAEPRQLAVDAFARARATAMSVDDHSSEQPDIPNYASAVVVDDLGPVIGFDTSAMTVDGMRKLAERMQHALEDAGVTAGVLDTASPSQEWSRVQGPAAALSVFPTAPSTYDVHASIPDYWLSVGERWVAGAADAQKIVGWWPGTPGSVPLAPDELAHFCRPRDVDGVPEGGSAFAISRTASRAMIVVAAPTAVVTFVQASNPPRNAYDDLVVLSRAIHSGVGYACVWSSTGFPIMGEPGIDLVDGTFSNLRGITDIRTPGVYPWQLLGPSHLAALDGQVAGTTTPNGHLEVWQTDENTAALSSIVARTRTEVRELLRGRGFWPGQT